MNAAFRLLLVVSFMALTHYSPHGFAFGNGYFGKKGMMGKKQGDFGSLPQGVNPEAVGAFVPQRANLEAMSRRGFVETGLVPRYPERFDCPPVGSPFASPYRTDGSERAARFFQGLHGGMDIAQPDGTPLLAMADGEVIKKHGGAAGGIGGIGLWMRHTPEDTGLGKYVFIEYKHLNALPALEPGQRVKMGQVVAHTGNTGTMGGYYGREGFHHLHMTAYWSDGPDFKSKRVLIPIGGQWLDPLALLRGGPLDSHLAQALPAEQKEVVIPFMSSNGQVYPEGARVIWPYPCAPR